LFSSHIARTIEAAGLQGTKAVRRLPAIPDEHFWHFLRGFMDGDGHIAARKRKDGRLSGVRLSFTCHPAFGAELQAKIVQLAGLPEKMYNHDEAEGAAPLKTICYYGSNAVLLANKIYQGATIYMDRKKKVFDNYFHN